MNPLSYFSLRKSGSGQFHGKKVLKKLDYSVELFFDNLIMFFWHGLFLKLLKVFNNAVYTVNIHADDLPNLELADAC